MNRKTKRPTRPSSPDPRTQGFTLIEILVAVTLLGVLIVSVLAPMGGLFSLGRTSSAQLDTAVTAQRVVEQIKGVWRTQAYYDRVCVAGVGLGGVTVTVTDLNGIGVASGAASAPATAPGCNTTALAAGFTPVPLRRVTVTAGSGAGATALMLDITRPTQ